MGKHIVVGFNIMDNEGNCPNYENLTDREKHELALSDESTIIYDCPNDFFIDMNMDLVDTENRFWYLIKIN